MSQNTKPKLSIFCRYSMPELLKAEAYLDHKVRNFSKENSTGPADINDFKRNLAIVRDEISYLKALQS